MGMDEGTLNLASRLQRVEFQIERIVSDIESEKRTTAMVNSDTAAKLDKISERQVKSDRILWMMLGGLALINVLLPLMGK